MEILKHLSTQALVVALKKHRGDEKLALKNILSHLSELQRRRGFAEYGCSSLYQFCMKVLSYTEAEANLRVRAVRVVDEIPEIESKISSGELTLSAVSKAQSFFNSQENPLPIAEKKEVLLKLENKSIQECELELLKLSPRKPLPKDKVKPITQTHVQVTVTISTELQSKLEKLKALMSHKNPHMTQSQLLEELAEIALQKLDPELKKQRTASMRARSDVSKNKRYISTATKREVYKRANGKCEFEGCGSQYFLETDHIVPISLGGTSDLENLRLLCRTHNQLKAIEALGFDHMNRFIN
jgi:hypothetical protein